ncbi:hypothetical protein ACWGKW_31160 [Streptomyces sp. NPDC054766]
MKERSVIVYPPVKYEGRKVEVDGVLVGRACGLRDLTEVLQRAGWEGLDEVDVLDLPAIEWHGGGPEAWSARG